MIFPKEQIKCSQFFCEEQVLNLCCKSCEVQAICKDKCLNSPDKCGLRAKKGLHKSLSSYCRIPMKDED